MTKAVVTILIPNYKTLELTQLCLRLLRKHTDPQKVKVIVIDNDSNDASLDYLRTLTWITLIERKNSGHETPVQSHARALDMGLREVSTPYVLSIHTDTLVKHPKWLEFLIKHIESYPDIAGIGSWKLESKPLWRQALKLLERRAQLIYYRLIGKTRHPIEGIGRNYYYLRSHCALYRTELLKKLNLHFADGNLVAGKHMHRQLMMAGYKMIFLPSEVLIRYVEHINHATTVLNPELSTRKKSVIKGHRRIRKSLKHMSADSILQDVSLDA